LVTYFFWLNFLERVLDFVLHTSLKVKNEMKVVSDCRVGFSFQVFDMYLLLEENAPLSLSLSSLRFKSVIRGISGSKMFF